MPNRVLVLGGGVSGFSAVQEFVRSKGKNPDLKITLVDRHRGNLFWPLLPDLISGRIWPENITYPLQPYCRKHGVEYIHAEVKAVFPSQNRVETTAGPLEADYIILCLGCETNYFGNENIKSHAPGLKSLHEGTLIRHQAKEVVANRKKTGDKGLGHIILVGGGYTGFEAASHLAHFLRACTGVPYSQLHTLVDLWIVEKGDKVLGNTSPGVQHWAEHLIGSYGVEVKTNLTAVSFEDDHNVRMSDGSLLHDAMVIWTAGVAPGPVCAALDVPKVHGNRLEVDTYLRVHGIPNLFAAGDLAGAMPPGHQLPLRMAFQFSLAGGRCAAGNVVRTIENRELRIYNPFDVGYVIPLAPGHAIGVILGLEMHGRIPFFLHYAMSVLRSYGWKNKIQILKDLFKEQFG
jgi:NADH:ubiquinone reductase (H+-translocating)